MSIFNKIITLIRNNFFNVIILILVGIIVLQRCDRGEDTPSTEPISVKRDTVWIKTKNTVVTNPVIVKTIPGESSTKFIPDPDYKKLVLQYQQLVKEFTNKNIHRDTIKVDSIGFVSIEDTVSYNKILGRKTSYSFKYPVITNTITLKEEKRNQLYYGGGLQGGQDQLIKQFNVGLLLKTKNDQIYNAYTGIDMNGQLLVGIQGYWKISFKK